MVDLKKNILFVPSILIFLAALIFAWAVTEQRAPQSGSSAQNAPSVQVQAQQQLPAGAPNPADSLPQLSAAAVTGKITAVEADAVTIQAGVLGGQAARSEEHTSELQSR